MAAGDELVSAADAEVGSKSGQEQQSGAGKSASRSQRGVSTASGFKFRRSTKGRL